MWNDFFCISMPITYAVWDYLEEFNSVTCLRYFKSNSKEYIFNNCMYSKTQISESKLNTCTTNLVPTINIKRYSLLLAVNSVCFVFLLFCCCFLLNINVFPPFIFLKRSMSIENDLQTQHKGGNYKNCLKFSNYADMEVFLNLNTGFESTVKVWTYNNKHNMV